VAIRKPEWLVRKTSHCGRKQKQKSHAVLTLPLLVGDAYIAMLFFTHIPFVVNRTFNVTPNELFKHLQQVGLDLLK